MSELPSIEFERLRYGKSDKFPHYAKNIFMLDGHEGLLHLEYRDYSKDNIMKTRRLENVKLREFRDGREHIVLAKAWPENKKTSSRFKDGLLRWNCDGKTLCVADVETNQGMIVKHGNGTFQSESVSIKCPPPNTMFFRKNDSLYYVIEDLFLNRVFVVSQNTFEASESLLEFVYKIPIVGRATGYCFVGQSFVAVYINRKSSTIKMNALRRGKFQLDRKNRVAIIDCGTVEVASFKYTEFTQGVAKCAVRSRGKHAELYVSTDSTFGCTIYKTVLPLDRFSATPLDSTDQEISPFLETTCSLQYSNQKKAENRSIRKTTHSSTGRQQSTSTDQESSDNSLAIHADSKQDSTHPSLSTDQERVHDDDTCDDQSGAFEQEPAEDISGTTSDEEQCTHEREQTMSEADVDVMPPALVNDVQKKFAKLAN